VSFNGRTADSGSANWGSNPCTPAIIKHAAWRPVSVYGTGGNAALLSTNKAEAF
jgi:hypothetical protein